jgi:hypothetical protein
MGRFFWPTALVVSLAGVALAGGCRARARDIELRPAELPPNFAKTERFYLGSVKNKILTVDRQGRVEPLIAPPEGRLEVASCDCTSIRAVNVSSWRPYSSRTIPSSMA